MRKLFFLFFNTFFLFITISFSYAQFEKGAGPRFYSEFRPVVGGWSEYQISAKGERPLKMKIAIVGKDGDAFWYETVMESKSEGKIITKMLVSGDPEDQKNLKKMIIKIGNEPAIEMPVIITQSQKNNEKQLKFVDKGEERIKVPAGTFDTRHLQYKDGEDAVDVWVYKEVYPYGLIKSRSKDMEMILIRYGTGAKTEITEVPQKFEMPKMPEDRQRRR